MTLLPCSFSTAFSSALACAFSRSSSSGSLIIKSSLAISASVLAISYSCCFRSSSALFFSSISRRRFCSSSSFLFFTAVTQSSYSFCICCTFASRRALSDFCLVILASSSSHGSTSAGSLNSAIFPEEIRDIISLPVSSFSRAIRLAAGISSVFPIRRLPLLNDFGLARMMAATS